jgi:hypothetical protein
LIDQTDWIYCEFISFSDQTPPCFLTPQHLNKQIEVSSFNICIEDFTTPASDSTKRIFSLQVDLRNCRLRSDETNESRKSFRNEECQVSHLKTGELLKLFASETVLVDDTLDEDDDESSQSSQKFKYLFRVVHLGQVHSLANSQFKTKLRADMRVDLVEIDSNKKQPNWPQPFVVALMSKFLFYYPFMRVDHCYMLCTREKLNLKSDKSVTMLVMDDSMHIDLNFDKSQVQNMISALERSGSVKKEAALELAINSNDEFLNLLTGVLLEKKLLESSNSAIIKEQAQMNESLINQFDLMLPNRQFRLVVKLKGDSNTFVTVYHDTRYSIHALSILPGKFHFL